MKKLLTIALSLVMVLALVGCQSTPKEPMAADQEYYNAETYTSESDALYNEILGDFDAIYAKAKAASSISERWALMAVAEAKMHEGVLMVPSTTRGGNYAISRIVPRSGSTVSWGNDDTRFETILVATEPLTPADRNAIKLQWEELKGTGTFLTWVKNYLAENGYELKDTLTQSYSTDPQTWDLHNTYRAADTEKIWPTVVALYNYDAENVQQPSAALSHEVSEDGTVYTFHLRQGIKWVDSQGREVGELTADDFVAGMQHLLDAEGGLESLIAGDAITIKNAPQYLNGEVTDFAEVGVKALDDYTVEYTLEEPATYFMSMLSYNMFAPLNRAFYESQGGVFGKDAFDATADSYLYGKSPESIAYCGPYYISEATAENSIVWTKNELFYDAANVQSNTVTWLYNDGTDATKAYNDTKNGVIDGAGLNTEAVVSAKADGLFDKYAYISDTDATSFMGFLNVNRKAYKNFNDETVGISPKTAAQAELAVAAMQNLHFRRAFVFAYDQADYNAQSVGEELKLNSLRNSYVPGNFVALEEDVTIDGLGTFPAGTYYGAIMQAQLDADGFPVKVWDAAEFTGDGFDGWYNPEEAVKELDLAIAELAEAGYEISEENPVYIDFGYVSSNTVRTNMANSLKKSIETVLGGKVLVNLIGFEDQAGWLYSGYYPDYGYEMNADFMNVSGWGPDYGDPQTYLDTMLGNPGGMVKSCGLY